MPHWPFSSNGNLKKRFWKNMPWCELEDHPFFRSDHSVKCPFFYSYISSNHPGGKSVVRQGIDSILSPKEQWRPLPSLLSDSSAVCSDPRLTCLKDNTFMMDLLSSRPSSPVEFQFYVSIFYYYIYSANMNILSEPLFSIILLNM